MTEPEAHNPIPETAGAAATTDAAPPAEAPAPEPWTPERVSEWNAYYDLYVMLGALLLVFVASANKISHSAIWTQLKAGQIIAERGRPLTSDPFSYTAEGLRWVNIPWLFEVSHAALHRGVYEAVPTDPNDPGASATRADQIAAGVLVGLNALVRALTMLVLLGIRRPGPGRWWAALCATLALGAIPSPTGVSLGGIAGIGVVGPEGWGLLLLALELLLIHRAVNLGRRDALFWLVPLFLAWANLDESFLFGLLILAATAAGRLGGEANAGAKDEARAPGASTLALVFGACLAACLVNPSTFRALHAAADPILGLVRSRGESTTLDQLSYFGKGIRQSGEAGRAWVYLAFYYLAVVGVGLGSFLLNRRRFSTARFLAFAVAALLWGALIRFGPEFAVVFAATLALNGQEWYHDRFGTAGRLGRGWATWSIGGRAATIVALFLLVAAGLTSWTKDYGDAPFGFGYDRNDFAFEAADFLRTAPIEGAVLNTNLNQGDALIWRTYPQRKDFIDGRKHLFPPQLVDRLQEMRRALSEDAVERWRPLLDEYKISVVMLQEANSPNTFRRLMQSPNWIPFYDDGNVVLFGRADATAADLAYFQANSIKDPEHLAFRREQPVPSPEGPPAPVSWMDRVFRNRAVVKPESHTDVASRWLNAIDPATGARELPDPAHCLLAIREARTALARRPDDWRAFRLLAASYRDLMVQETALMAGLRLTPEDRPRVARIVPQPGLLMTRFRQRATALNFAIQTTPPPESPQAAHELRALNLELYDLYLSVNYIDLARDRLRAVVDSLAAEAKAVDFDEEGRAQIRRQLAQLDDRITKVREQMDELTAEQQVGPLQRASFAMSQGAPGLALLELEEADRTGLNPAVVRPQLLDLLCDTGQPERAVELLGSGNVEDPALGAEPGVPAFRQARVYLLLGNYEYAGSLLQERAIPQLRYERGFRALSAAQAFTRGDALSVSNTLVGLPARLGTQAVWEFELALCRLESGLPGPAAEHLTKALTLAPDLTQRPVAAYYLEKLGKPVPPASAQAPKAPATATPTPKPEPAKDEKVKDEPGSPKNEAPKGETPKPGPEKS